MRVFFVLVFFNLFGQAFQDPSKIENYYRGMRQWKDNGGDAKSESLERKIVMEKCVKKNFEKIDKILSINN